MPSVRGDLLSCYSTSIATYMQCVGIDYRMAVGTQLFLAVHYTNPTLLRFIHYHTPLLGETPTHNLHLTPANTIDPQTALHILANQCKTFGAAIMCGDAAHLPWVSTRQHLPHWYVVTAVDMQKGALTICDPFEFQNEEGLQFPFHGCVNASTFATIARTGPTHNPVLQSRDNLAFGLHTVAMRQPIEGYHWFKADSMPRAKTLTPTLQWELLQRTWAFYTGKYRREDLSAEWMYGQAAFSPIIDFFAEHMQQLTAYIYRDDLWVAARQRQLFVETLDDVGKELRLSKIVSLVAWAKEQYLPQWRVLPGILQYNFLRLQRGKKPVSSTLSTALQKVAEDEELFMQRLGQCL